MPARADAQGAFAAAVLDASLDVPEGLTSHTGPRPRKRFNIHRNNVFVSLTDVLAGRYPAVQRLVGEEFFRATARVFVATHRPASPVLLDYGEGFADFLDGFGPAAELPYLADVARLEWAWNAAYHAADATPLDAEALAAAQPADIAAATIALHPSLRLVASPYPIVTLWTAMHDEAGLDGVALEDVDRNDRGEDALVLRPSLDVEVRRLPRGAVSFIAALAEGHPLAYAAELALAADASFALDANLAGLIESGAICGGAAT